MHPDFGAPIVIDAGSGFTKAGFAGDKAPQTVFPTVVGYDERPHNTACMAMKNYWVGKGALARREQLALCRPVETLVKNWDAMEKVWHHAIYNGLRSAPEEHPVLVTVRPVFDYYDGIACDSTKTTEMMFETFNVPACATEVDSVLSLFASGRHTGLVVSSGYSSSYAVPIMEGRCVSRAVTRLDIGGRDITEYLAWLFKDKGYSPKTLKSPAAEDVMNEIKHNLCYVSGDYEAEFDPYTDKPKLEQHSYELPDGKVLDIGYERFKAGEVVFAPYMLGLETSAGLHNLASWAIAKCEKWRDGVSHRELYLNIVMAGGNTMFPGVDDRMTREMCREAHRKALKVKVISPPDRQYSAWIGGSILASSSQFQSAWITRQDYEEFGTNIIHRTSL